jgi:hypothetical protein
MNESVLTDDTGSTLQHILNTFKRDVKDFKETGEVSQHLHDALYDYYKDDMPYGVQKARDGDPYEWVADRFGKDLGLSGYGMFSPGVGSEDNPSLERESVMHGDYAEEKNAMRKLAGLPPEETDEGVLGTAAGGLAGTLTSLATGTPIDVGATVGAGLGQAATSGGSSIIEQDDEETDEGWKGQLAGGTVGTLAGGALGAVGGPIGAAVGGALGGTAGQMIGDKLGGKEETNEDDASLFDDATCNMTEAGESCPVHGMEECYGADTSPLAGQYGHSGKMKAVDKNLSFLDRLKELSGLSK